MANKKYTKEWLEELCKESFSYSEVCRKAGRKPAGGNITYVTKKIKEFKIDTSHFTGKGWSKGKTLQEEPSLANRLRLQFSDIFIEDSTTARGVIRKYILRFDLIPYKCSFCENEGLWRGSVIALHLDHINGINNDNRIENLRFLCPNCHAATPTYAGNNNSK